MKKHSILWWLLIGWWYYLYIWWWLTPLKLVYRKLIQKNITTQTNTSRHATEYYGVGTMYYKNNIETLLEVTENWNDRKYQKDIIYKYYPMFEGLKLTLESEPTNKHDPNAIKIKYGKNTLAYIASEETSKVRNKIKLPAKVNAQIYGGPKKVYDPAKGKYYISEYTDFTIKIII